MLAFSYGRQGDQVPHMGEAWRDDEAWELVARASEVAGRDVEHLLTAAGAEELRQTRNAQLAIHVLGLVAERALRRAGLSPEACVGHSVGEYAALVSAGALSFEDGVRLVAERADAMQAADEDNPGAMTAIVGLDDDDVESACSRADGDVWVANYNAPGHTVVAGAPTAVRAAEEAALDVGAKRVIPVDVAGAYHTRFMAPARARLREALASVELRQLDVPVVANVDARAHASAADWPGLLSAQLCSPVRWNQSARRLAAMGVTTVVHLGPNPSLARMLKRSEPSLRVLTVQEPVDVEVAAALAHGGLAELDALGEPGSPERVIVSPVAGVYRPAPGQRTFTADGEIVSAGDVVGMVDDEPVPSPFTGWLMGLFAREGDRVRKGQPIARLRLV